MNLRTLFLCVVSGLIGFGVAHLSISGPAPSSMTPPGRLSPRAASGSPSLESFEAAIDDNDPLTHSLAYSAFLRTLSPENLDGALAILAAHQSDVSEQDLRVFMMAWSRFDAPGAFDWARTHDTTKNNPLLQAASFAWGYRDPRAAIAKLDAIGEDPKQSPPYSQVIKAWAKNGDVEGLSQYIVTMPKTNGRIFATAELTKWIARDGIDALIRWAESVPGDAPEGFKRLAFHEAASTIARRDAERALVWFGKHQGQPYAAQTLGMIARRWVDFHDAKGLMPRLQQLPESSDRRQAIEVGMRWWLRKNPEDALAWLKGLESVPPELDPAIAATARYSAQKSPSEATLWAARISDEALRGEALQRYGRQWRAKAPEELQAWLETSNLSLSEKASILSGPVQSRQLVIGQQGKKKKEKKKGKRKKGKKAKKHRSSRRLPG